MARIRFGVICDCQYTDSDDESFLVSSPSGDWQHQSNRYYRSSKERLARAVNYFNTQPLDFVVHLGDLADRQESDFTVVRPVLEELTAPLYHVLGNHDYSASGRSQQQACNNLGLASPYYSFCQQGVTFIVLDSNQCSLIDVTQNDSGRYERQRQYLRQLRQEGKSYAQTYNGGIDDKQKEWLIDMLQQAKRDSSPVVIFAHHPVFPPNMHNMLNCEELLAIFDNFPPIAFMNGHNHAGGFGIRRGVPYVTFPGMVESLNDAYSVVTINEDSLVFRGFGSHHDGMVQR